MLNVKTSNLVTRQVLWPFPNTHTCRSVACVSSVAATGAGGRHPYNAPLRPGRQPSSCIAATASDIIADVLNEEHKHATPASLLELLDQQGWGVATEITRKFSTKFARITLEASWDDDPSGRGRVASRRLAVLAVYQEWLVARSKLVGELVDSLERLRPGYLPRELVEKVRSARSAPLLTPDTEALDAPALLLLAAVVAPPEQLTAHLDSALAATRREVLQGASYRGRPDLVPSLDRGLLLLRASAVRLVHLALFRATHMREALELEAELRRQRLARQPRREEATSGVMGMWFREARPEPAAAGPGTCARAANERLYAGQLAPEALPWMAEEERGAAASAAAGRSGPRGLPGGRVGEASFRPFPGAALYGYPGLSGGSSFGSSARLAFSQLDAAVQDVLSKADYGVPAAALSTFGRLHRTALLDLLTAWQWGVLMRGERGQAAAGAKGPGAGAGAGGAPVFYQPRCAHATDLRPPGPLQVSRHTRIDVAPGRELDELRALARRRGGEVLQVVHPLAWKQATIKGEWEYWREAHRLWTRYASMPPYCRSTSLALVLTPEQVPYVGLLEAEAAGRAAAASVAIPAASPSTDELDIASLTSMSSMDLDDAPLPLGRVPGLGGGTTAATAVAAGEGAAATASSNTAGGGSPAQQLGATKPAGRTSVQTETTVQILVPPDELRRFLLALLDLLPTHVGEGTGAASLAAAAAAAVGPGRAVALPGPTPSGPREQMRAASSSSSSSSSPGGWEPAGATTLQIRHCSAAEAAPGDSGPGASWPSAAGGAGVAAERAGGPSAVPGPPGSPTPSPHRLPEEMQPSCYELRWALGSAALTTAPAGPSGAAAYSRMNISPPAVGAGGQGGGWGAVASPAVSLRWCTPLRLTQAQLMSLVNIFTDMAQQLPELYGIEPQRLVVPTLSPLERLVSALQGVAGSVVRVAGLLALLAVPLAAAVKAGGGELGAGGLGGRAAAGRFAGGVAAAAVGAVRPAPVSPPRATASAAEAAPEAAAPQQPAAAAAMAAARSPAPGLPASELAALCRLVESAVEGAGQGEGRLWLEVSGTRAAAVVGEGRGVLPRWLQASGLLDPAAGLAPGAAAALASSWPEFQLVVERAGGRVVGCRPVNAAARAVLPELPLAAALRGPAAERAAAERLRDLTRERVEQGRATPGRFHMPYSTATFHMPYSTATCRKLPAVTPTSPPSAAVVGSGAVRSHQVAAAAGQPGSADPHSQEAAAALPGGAPAPARGEAETPAPGPQRDTPAPTSADAAEAAARPGNPSAFSPSSSSPTSAPRSGEASASAGSGQAAAAPPCPVVVLKLELRPSGNPARHAVQRRAGREQREYAQADVVVRPWYDSDSLLCWMDSGVQLPSLGSEMAAGLLDREECERAAFLEAYDRLVGRAEAGAGAGAGVSELDEEPGPAESGSREGAAGAELSAAAGGQEAGSGAAVGGGGAVLKPQQLSEQQLQEALQELLLTLGVPRGNLRVAPGAGASVSAAAVQTVVAAAADGPGGRGSAAGSSS